MCHLVNFPTNNAHLSCFYNYRRLIRSTPRSREIEASRLLLLVNKNYINIMLINQYMNGQNGSYAYALGPAQLAEELGRGAPAAAASAERARATVGPHENHTMIHSREQSAAVGRFSRLFMIDTTVVFLPANWKICQGVWQ